MNDKSTKSQIMVYNKQNVEEKDMKEENVNARKKDGIRHTKPYLKTEKGEKDRGF